MFRIFRNYSFTYILIFVNLMLFLLIGHVVADEVTDNILYQSVYLYYYESHDVLLGDGESQIYTFAPIPGEKVTIVTYGLDDVASTSITLHDSHDNFIRSASNNQVTFTYRTSDNPTSPYITAIQHTALNNGIYWFEVKNESGIEGLIRTMLFVGDPIDLDITLIDNLNPLLPSKAFMVTGDSNTEWFDSLTGEVVKGLRTEIEVLPIDVLERVPDVFLSYSTLTHLPKIDARLTPVKFSRWFNDDDRETYLINISPLPEQETEANSTILEHLHFDTYDTTNNFFFDYLFSVGEGSDPVALDRDAGACANLANRIDCVANDPNFGREETTQESSTSGDKPTQDNSPNEFFPIVEPSGDNIGFGFTSTACTSLFGTGVIVVIVDAGGNTTTICVPNRYLDNVSITSVTSISGTDPDSQNVCIGTDNPDIIACTTGDDWIEGLAGDDAIFAAGGDDVIFGDSGIDFVAAGDGDDTIHGGADNDGLLGETGDDLIYGGAGSDRIDGGTGNDTIYGDDDNDIILGGTGDDFINGGAAEYTGSGSIGINGSLGETSEHQIVFGGSGADTIVIDSSHSSSTNAFSLVAGNEYNENNFSAITDSQQDTYVFDGDPTGEVYLWTDNEDLLDFSTFDNSVNMLGGDYVNSGDLDILIFDGGLPSNISGSNNADTFDVDDCVIDFASGCSSDPDYMIDGRAGNDTFITGDGDDTIDGGDGDDTYDASNTSNSVSVDVSNTITVTGADVGTDTLDNVESIITGDGDDTFTINTDVDGTYTLNAGGETSTGNVFEFIGNGTATLDLTVDVETGVNNTFDFSGFIDPTVTVNISDPTPQNIYSNIFVTIRQIVSSLLSMSTATANSNLDIQPSIVHDAQLENDTPDEIIETTNNKKNNSNPSESISSTTTQVNIAVSGSVDTESTLITTDNVDSIIHAVSSTDTNESTPIAQDAPDIEADIIVESTTEATSGTQSNSQPTIEFTSDDENILDIESEEYSSVGVSEVDENESTNPIDDIFENSIVPAENVDSVTDDDSALLDVEPDEEQNTVVEEVIESSDSTVISNASTDTSDSTDNGTESVQVDITEIVQPDNQTTEINHANNSGEDSTSDSSSDNETAGSGDSEISVNDTAQDNSNGGNENNNESTDNNSSNGNNVATTDDNDVNKDKNEKVEENNQAEKVKTSTDDTTNP